MRRLTILLFFSGMFIFPQITTGTLAATAKPAFPLSVLDDHGNRVTIRHLPKRIISLFPRDTETLFALGVEKRVVGDGSQYAEGATDITDASGKPRDFRYPSEWPSKLGRDYPVRAPQLPHIEGGCCGTPFNLETIESLQPDLVIVPYTKTELPTYQKLRELGLTVLIIDPANINAIMHDVTLLGKVTGADKQARAVTAGMKAGLKTLSGTLAKIKSRPRVYYELDATNPDAPITAGPGTYIDEAIHRAGGKNIADGVTSCGGTLCYPSFSLESLVHLNPQVILFSIYERIYNKVTPDTIRSRSGWSSMAAVATGRIFEFNDDLVSRGGPRTVIGIKAIAHLVHPDAFKKP